MRSLEIIKVLMKNFILNKNSKIPLGKRIKNTCEELGPSFIKIGQILSVRYDLLPKEDCKILEELLDNVKQFPYSKVQEIFKHDFGKLPEEIFEFFDPVPIASASVSQVYKAKLKSGEDVAVKVRRPYIGNVIKKDAERLIKIIQFLQLFSKTLRNLHAVSFTKEIRQWLLQEIDFENEVKNMKIVREEYSFCEGVSYRSDLGAIIFPKPFEEFCSKNIITMSFINGIPLNKIDSIKNNPEYDISLSLKSYLNSTIHQLLNGRGDYFFQADTHPANILILKQGKVSAIDFGLMQKISHENVKLMKDLFLSVYLKDVKKVLIDMSRFCKTDLRKYGKQLEKDFKKYLDQAQKKGIGFWFAGILKILVKYKIPSPTFLNAFARSNFVLEGIFKIFDPSKTTIELLDIELKEALRKQMINELKQINYNLVLYNFVQKLKDSPELVNSIINKYYSDFKGFFIE